MKKIFILLAYFCFILTSCEPENNSVEPPSDGTSGYPICEGSYLIYTRSDTNILLYCSSVTGDITVYSPMSQLMGLENFKNLNSISGNLDINGEKILDLKGLENLKEIGGNLILSEVTNISSVDLSSLEKIGGDIILSGVTNLESIDLGKLERIEGDFIIDGSTKLSSMNLKNLKSIGGKFGYQNNSSELVFNSLNSLESVNEISFLDNSGLESIGGFEILKKLNLLNISNNSDLKKIKGFTNLLEVNNVNVESNKSLTDINGFDVLKLILKNITIKFNSVLINIPAFNDLNQTGNLYISHNHINFSNAFPALKGAEEIFIGTNTHEGNFQSFRELETVGTYFGIYQNYFSSFHGPDKLKNATNMGFNNGTRGKLEGFDQLSHLDGALNIWYHEDLVEVLAFNNLKTIRGNLNIQRNDKILNLTPLLNSVEEVGGEFHITDNAAIEQFWVGEQLKFVGGPVIIYMNQSLIKAGGFNGVTNAFENIFITNNYSLNEFTGFAGITSIGYILIDQNRVMEKISGFTSLKSTESELIIAGNSELALIDGFGSMEEVGTYFTIGGGKIPNLVNFDNLKKIGLAFTIGNEKEIRSLQGMENLTSPIKNININNNPELTDISALRNIETITESINVMANERLSSCSISTFCEFIAAGRGGDFQYNAEGCNSTPQVKESCGI